MKDFPKESIEQARWVVEKYKRRSNSKLEYAANLYDNYFIRITYGFSEAIKKGNCGLYFHEIDKECDCFTHLGVSYLVAREAGLKPQMWWGLGIKDQAEGADLNEISPLDHGFITAEVGKNKTLLLDNQMGLYGLATFDRKHNIIQVYDKKRGEITYRHYQHLAELSQEEYLTRLEKNRSPEGGRIVLSTTQRIKGANEKQVYLTYLPDTHELKSSLHSKTIQFGPESYNKWSIEDLVTTVNEDGTYDFKNGDLYFYYASNSGWSEHENSQVPFVFPVKDAEKAWEIFNPLVRETGRKSPARSMRTIKLIEMIKEAGFNDNFTIKPNSKAFKVIRKFSLEKNLEDIQIAQKKEASRFVREAQKDEITYKSLLRYAHYIKASDKRKSKNNPKGFVFPKQEHEALLKEEFEKYKEATQRYFDIVVECAAIRAGLKRGSRYHADRISNQAFELEKRRARYFDEMSWFHKSKIPIAFHISADSYLFNKQFDLEKMSVNRLKKGLIKKDLKRVAQLRLFNWLIVSYIQKEALFLASYKKGLQKILDRRKN